GPPAGAKNVREDSGFEFQVSDFSGEKRTSNIQRPTSNARRSIFEVPAIFAAFIGQAVEPTTRRSAGWAEVAGWRGANARRTGLRFDTKETGRRIVGTTLDVEIPNVGQRTIRQHGCQFPAQLGPSSAPSTPQTCQPGCNP